MSACNSQSFTTQPVAKVIWRNSLPMVGAILALFAYDLLESTLLAFQSENVLTAFGFTLPITAAMVALTIGLSIRTNNKVVHCNCTNKEYLSEMLGKSFASSVLIVGLFSLLFFLSTTPLLFATGSNQWLSETSNSAEIYGQSSYLNLRYAGWIFLAVIWQVSATLRALGWMRIASHLMFTWALTKSLIALTLLTPQSPFYSDGLATLGLVHFVTDTIFAFTSLFLLSTKIDIKLPSFKALKRIDIKNSTDSLLIIAQQFITPISMAVLTAIAASIDSSYVAALALLFRLEVLFLLLPMVLTTTIPAIVGANFWLDHKIRVQSIYKFAFTTIALFQFAIAVLVYSQSQLLSAFVCPHDAIAFHLANYLHWVPWAYGAAGIAIVFQSCLNAKNKTLQATIVGLSHRILFVLPLTAFGAYIFDHNGFYIGLMLGHLGAIVAVIYLVKQSGIFSTNTNTTTATYSDKNTKLTIDVHSHTSTSRKGINNET